MGRVREIGTDRDRPSTVENPPIGPHDRRKGRDCRHRVVHGVLLAAEAENGYRHSQRIHRRHLRRGGLVDDGKGGAGERPPSGQILHEPNVLGWFGQAALQKEVRHFLETGVRRQIFDGVPRDGQPTRLAIDLAEPGRGGDDPIQALCHPSIVGARSQIVNIDCRINLKCRQDRIT